MAEVAQVDLRGLIPSLTPPLHSIFDALILLRQGELQAISKVDGHELPVPKSIWLEMNQSEFEAWVNGGDLPYVWHKYARKNQRKDLKALRAKLTFPRVDRAIEEIDLTLVGRIPSSIFSQSAVRKRVQVRGFGRAANILRQTNCTSIAELMAKLQQPAPRREGSKRKSGGNTSKLKNQFWQLLEAALEEWEHGINSTRICFEPYVSREDVMRLKVFIGSSDDEPQSRVIGRKPRAQNLGRDPTLRNRIESVIAAAKRDGHNTKPSVLVRKLLGVKKQAFGFGFEALRQILRGTYGAQMRRGIKGLYG